MWYFYTTARYLATRKSELLIIATRLKFTAISGEASLGEFRAHSQAPARPHPPNGPSASLRWRDDWETGVSLFGEGCWFPLSEGTHFLCALNCARGVSCTLYSMQMTPQQEKFPPRKKGSKGHLSFP